MSSTARRASPDSTGQATAISARSRAAGVPDSVPGDPGTPTYVGKTESCSGPVATAHAGWSRIAKRCHAGLSADVVAAVSVAIASRTDSGSEGQATITVRSAGSTGIGGHCPTDAFAAPADRGSRFPAESTRSVVGSTTSARAITEEVVVYCRSAAKRAADEKLWDDFAEFIELTYVNPGQPPELNRLANASAGTDHQVLRV
jgi:hypothetical protein